MLAEVSCPTQTRFPRQKSLVEAGLLSCCIVLLREPSQSQLQSTRPSEPGLGCLPRDVGLARRVRTSAEYAERLRRLHVPTLIIAGEHDAWSLQMSEEMHANIAGSELLVLPKSRHMTFVDQTGMFNNAVDQFLHSTIITAWAPREGEDCTF